MGIRPTFYVLVGIDDVLPDDPRRIEVDPAYVEELLNYRDLKPEECWREDSWFDDYIDAVERKMPGTSNNLADKLYNAEGGSEWYLGNVVGYIVHRGPHDDSIIRALATIDEKYLSTGYERIPMLDPDEHQMMYRHYKYTEEDVRCNRFVSSVFESMPSISRMNWKRAQHYLRLIGWDVPEEDLRYLLVWNWS